MNYYLFCKKEKKINLFDVLFIVLLIASFIFALLGLSKIFEIVLIIDVIIWFIKLGLDNKDRIKNSNQAIIDNPIFIENDNVYILQDKIARLALFCLCGCLFIEYMLLSESEYFYLIMLLIMIIFYEISVLLKRFNVKNLKNKGADNIYNFLNNNYKMNKIERITKNENGTYVIKFMNRDKEVAFSKEYDNYEELIQQLDQRCS